jgi:hypothetical protein
MTPRATNVVKCRQSDRCEPKPIPAPPASGGSGNARGTGRLRNLNRCLAVVPRGARHRVRRRRSRSRGRSRSRSGRRRALLRLAAQASRQTTRIQRNPPLGGLEPPTSWVGSSNSAIEKMCGLQDIRDLAPTLQTAAMTGDARRFSWFQALFARSARTVTRLLIRARALRFATRRTDSGAPGWTRFHAGEAPLADLVRAEGPCLSGRDGACGVVDRPAMADEAVACVRRPGAAAVRPRRASYGSGQTPASGRRGRVRRSTIASPRAGRARAAGDREACEQSTRR